MNYMAKYLPSVHFVACGSPGNRSVESPQPNPACHVHHLIQAEPLLSGSHTGRKAGATGVIMLMSVFISVCVDPKLSLSIGMASCVCVSDSSDEDWLQAAASLEATFSSVALH